MMSTVAPKPFHVDISQRRSPRCRPPWHLSLFMLILVKGGQSIAVHHSSKAIIAVKGDHPNDVDHGSEAILRFLVVKETNPMMSTVAPKPFHVDFSQRRSPRCRPPWHLSLFMLILVNGDHPNAVQHGTEAIFAFW